jgi:hypothetical protein
MDNYILKTIIFITKDKRTNKPVVITQWNGFETEQEALDFSNYLKEMTLDEMLEENPKDTIH